MKVSDLKAGDILVYRNGVVHYVNENKMFRYLKYFNNDLTNKENHNYDIMLVQRYKRCLCFYRKKTIYARENDN